MQCVTIECQKCEAVVKREFDGVLVLGMENETKSLYINHDLDPGVAICQILEALSPEVYDEVIITLGLYLANRRLNQGEFD